MSFRDPHTASTLELEGAEKELVRILETRDTDGAFMIVESTLKDLRILLKERKAVS